MQTELESRPQAMIAMSGGVDSSVAAYLMQQAGYACMGATMRLYENEDAGLPRGSTCCALDDVEDARRVAYALGMPYYVFNYKDAFREQVMARFAAAYQHGATPNPCLDCNRYLKFGLLETRARALGSDPEVEKGELFYAGIFTNWKSAVRSCGNRNDRICQQVDYTEPLQKIIKRN